jgi:ATP-dependent DNA helicase RecG
MKETQNIEFKRLQFLTFEQVRGGMLATIPRERFVAINNGTSQKSGQEMESGTETTQKTTEKTTEKILRLIKENPSITNKELATLCEITEDGVYYHIKKMKAEGIIRRIGPDKVGHWEVGEKS